MTDDEKVVAMLCWMQPNGQRETLMEYAIHAQLTYVKARDWLLHCADSPVYSMREPRAEESWAAGLTVEQTMLIEKAIRDNEVMT
jgi:hypothetical protein